MIDKFGGEYEWASNMYIRPMLIGTVTYQSNEHFFASNKTLSKEEQQAIINAATPYQAKKLGKECTLRSDWNQIRIPIMAYGLYHKFFQHVDLRQKLIETGGGMLVEGNWWHDNFWGDCKFTYNFQSSPCSRCASIIGRNKLGLLLQTTRQYFATFNAVYV
jgi:hypothetical protein